MISATHCFVTQHTITCIRDVFADVETELVRIFLVIVHVFTRQFFIHIPIILYKHMLFKTLEREFFCNKNCLHETKIYSFLIV